MSLHPALAPALVEQRRRDLTSQASVCRRARAARQGYPRNPARRPPIIRAFRATAAVAAIAAAAFLVTPAGTAHAASNQERLGAQYQANGRWGTGYQGHGSWGTGYQGHGDWGTGYQGHGNFSVVAVTFRNRNWYTDYQGTGHHFE